MRILIPSKATRKRLASRTRKLENLPVGCYQFGWSDVARDGALDIRSIDLSDCVTIFP